MLPEPRTIDAGCGTVTLLDVRGSDATIAAAARKSYQRGTRHVSSDRRLIRYLVRHRHTSPFEMAAVVYELDIPIYVARQLMRHRTASVNETSLRYSLAETDFRLPREEDIALQSRSNRQGREEGTMDESDRAVALEAMRRAVDVAAKAYAFLTGEVETFDDLRFHARETRERGVARELARIVLPLCTPTRIWFEIDVHNLLHLLRLRIAEDAQTETRAVARAMMRLAEPYFPETFAAWRDYVLDAVVLTAPEIEAIAAAIDRRTAEDAIGHSPRLDARERREAAAKIARISESATLRNPDGDGE